jgi:hypothetical protein
VWSKHNVLTISITSNEAVISPPLASPLILAVLMSTEEKKINDLGQHPHNHG